MHASCAERHCTGLPVLCRRLVAEQVCVDLHVDVPGGGVAGKGGAVVRCLTLLDERHRSQAWPGGVAGAAAGRGRGGRVSSAARAALGMRASRGGGACMLFAPRCAPRFSVVMTGLASALPPGPVTSSTFMPSFSRPFSCAVRMPAATAALQSSVSASTCASSQAPEAATTAATAGSVAASATCTCKHKHSSTSAPQPCPSAGIRSPASTAHLAGCQRVIACQAAQHRLVVAHHHHGAGRPVLAQQLRGGAVARQQHL